jgi:hypothetical protein
MNKNSLRICAIILTYSTQQKQKPGCAGTSISVDASGNPADCGSINLVLVVPAKKVAGYFIISQTVPKAFRHPVTRI